MKISHSTLVYSSERDEKVLLCDFVIICSEE